MKHWFVIHTQTQKESIAQQHLLQQNFEVYVPRFNKLIKHARKVSHTQAPLFPRYIFVALDLAQESWRSINGTRGVAYLLTTNGNPAIVPDWIINDLKAQENSDGLVSADLNLFATGDKVRVLDGAFKDHTATVDQLDDQQRVSLLLSFLGRELKLSVPLYAVEAA